MARTASAFSAAQSMLGSAFASVLGWVLGSVLISVPIESDPLVRCA